MPPLEEVGPTPTPVTPPAPTPTPAAPKAVTLAELPGAIVADVVALAAKDAATAKPAAELAGPAKVEEAEDAEAAPEIFRHATCADCERAIADDEPAVVYPYAHVSYHLQHAPAFPPPVPPAVEDTEA